MAASTKVHAKKNTFSFSVAKEVMEKDKMSCFESITACKHIVLSPKYLGRIKEGIMNQLEAEKNVFSDVLEGAVIAYNNIKLRSSSGTVVNEESHIHFDIQADFIVFRPFVGATLKGKVNRVFKQHVVCLVHDSFNAPIHKPKGQTGGWAGSNLTVGDSINFTVTNVYINNGVLSMRGELLDTRKGSKKKQKRNLESTGEMVAINITENDRESGDVNHDSAYHTNSSIDEEHMSPGKKKKKKKLKKTAEEEQEDVDAENDSLETNFQEELSILNTDDKVRQSRVTGAEVNDDEGSKVRKARKRKHKDSSLDAGGDSHSYNCGENTEEESSFSLQSEKKHKKHKRHKKDSFALQTTNESDFTSIKLKSVDLPDTDRLANNLDVHDSDVVSKPKKKKKDKRQSIEVQHSDEGVSGILLVTDDKHCRKSKKKHKYGVKEIE